VRTHACAGQGGSQELPSRPAAGGGAAGSGGSTEGGRGGGTTVVPVVVPVVPTVSGAHSAAGDAPAPSSPSGLALVPTMGAGGRAEEAKTGPGIPRMGQLNGERHPAGAVCTCLLHADRRCCNAAAAPHSTDSTCFQREVLGHVQMNTTLWDAPHW
jgi:hypothetical protein